MGHIVNGSSPRVRGTPPLPEKTRFYMRFIPTGAGNTAITRKDKVLYAVHPHGCGEHPPSEGANRSPFGSSPRVRGTLVNPVIV